MTLNFLVAPDFAPERFAGWHLLNTVLQKRSGLGLHLMTPATAAEQAALGIDIGGTLIGMHLRRVAVPVRLSMDHIGEAILLCARTRPPFIGGSRAVYSDTEVR